MFLDHYDHKDKLVDRKFHYKSLSLKFPKIDILHWWICSCRCLALYFTWSIFCIQKKSLILAAGCVFFLKLAPSAFTCLSDEAIAKQGQSNFRAACKMGGFWMVLLQLPWNSRYQDCGGVVVLQEHRTEMLPARVGWGGQPLAEYVVLHHCRC